ncbi:hypothetical protein N9Z27_01985 [Alphaproteobacteria bacterium]|nr:hypothetical protein [Alphaproteobacteria bacterium]
MVQFIDPELLRQAQELAETAGGAIHDNAGAIALTFAVTASGIAIKRSWQASEAKAGSAKNRYGAGKDYRAYLTFTDYLPVRGENGAINHFEQHTDPDFMWGNPQKRLSEIFGDHTGTPYFVKQFRHARDAADKRWSNLPRRARVPWRYKDIDQQVLVLERMKRLKPKEFKTLWPAMKDPWDIFFRGYIKENEIKKKLAAIPAEDEELYKTPVTYYPCLVDEPGANYRQGRIILISKEQVEAGVEALPDPESIWVYNGEDFVKGMDFYENDQHHNKMERYHTMVQLIGLLQDPYWKKEIGLTVPGFRIRKKEKKPESKLWLPENYDKIWTP